jgi:hypothetical protein
MAEIDDIKTVAATAAAFWWMMLLKNMGSICCTLDHPTD